MVSHRKTPLFALLLLLIIIPIMPLHAGDEYPQFAVIGDTKIGTVESVYIKFLHNIEQDKTNLIFFVGDVIDRPGNPDEWKRFLSLTGPDRTFHIAPGNHDINNYKSLKVFKQYIGKPVYYSFYIDGTQFIILCTDLPDEISRVTGKQLEWLKAELEKPFTFRFVFLHKPLFPTTFGRGFGLDKYPAKRDLLHNMFVKAHVAAVFSGHEHLYHRGEKEGVQYVITGGGGSRLLALTEEQGGFFHYIVAKRLNEGYLFTVYDLDGHEKDHFSINR